MEGGPVSVLNALTAMKTSQALVRSISTNIDILRVHWQGLGVVTQAWNPQHWAEASGHKTQINRGGWYCQGCSHTHKLQFTFLTAPWGPFFLAKPCRLSLNQFSHSLFAPQTRLITFAPGTITVTHTQEPERGSLSRNRTNYFSLHRGLALKCQMEQVGNLLERFFFITQNEPESQRSPAELCHVWDCALQSVICCARYESS